MSKPLTEIIPWRRTIWTCGFVKTTLSGSLISTGVVLIFNGVTNHPLFDGINEIAIMWFYCNYPSNFCYNEY